MKNVKKVVINKKEIIIKELTVRQIIEIGKGFTQSGASKEDKKDLSLDTFIKGLREYFPMSIDGVTVEELIDFTPSELDELYAVFKEVNKSFLAMIEKAGFGEVLRQLMTAMKKDFSDFLANSLKRVT
jgi:hypothetical protein